MNDPELFNSLTLNDNNTEFLDLPEELRQMIFNYSRIDDMKTGLIKELKYHNLMEKQIKDLANLEIRMRLTRSPIAIRKFRQEKLINSERKLDEINDERMIMEGIIYSNVWRKARIMQVRNNHYFS